jgi:mRNA interferase MazF
MYTQGEIVLVPFPFTDQKGSVKRPALVISSNDFNRNSYDIILVQLTKEENQDGNSIPLERKDLTVPLDHISEVRCHKILVAEQSIIIKPVSNVRHYIVKKVIAKINGIIS